MTEMQGWVKLHRSLLEWEWIQNANVLQVFMFCLLKANHKDKKWQGRVVKRGQFITGRRKLAEETKQSEKVVRNALKKLEKTGEISVQKTNSFSLITVNNFDLYQEDEGQQKASNNPRQERDLEDEEQERGQQKASKGPAEGHQRAIKGPQRENDKNDKNDKNEKKPPNPPFQNPTKPKLKKWVAENGYPEEFEQLYELSDKKRDKLAALVYWAALSESEREAVRQHWPQYAKITRNNYQKLFRTYLDDRGWEIDLKSLQPGNTENKTSKRKIYDPSLGF